MQGLQGLATSTSYRVAPRKLKRFERNPLILREMSRACRRLVRRVQTCGYGQARYPNEAVECPTCLDLGELVDGMCRQPYLDVQVMPWLLWAYELLCSVWRMPRDHHLPRPQGVHSARQIGLFEPIAV